VPVAGTTIGSATRTGRAMTHGCRARSPDFRGKWRIAMAMSGNDIGIASHE
jgi:hypothetical protein